MELKLTKLQAEEVGHKISVLCDTPDLQEDYGISQEQAEELYKSIPDKGVWIVPDWAVEAVKGELADHAKILRALAENARSADDTGRMLADYRLAKQFDDMAGQS